MAAVKSDNPLHAEMNMCYTINVWEWCPSTAIDYAQLAEFCRSRLGQTIVCEKAAASWLPFVPMKNMRTSKGTDVEGIWSNEQTNYDNVQMKLAI